MHLSILKLYFSLLKGDAKNGRGKDKLVVKTMFNPSKSAIVVDSHIKNPPQTRGKGCAQPGEKCSNANPCCSGACYFTKRGIGKCFMSQKITPI